MCTFRYGGRSPLGIEYSWEILSIMTKNISNISSATPLALRHSNNHPHTSTEWQRKKKNWQHYNHSLHKPHKHLKNVNCCEETTYLLIHLYVCMSVCVFLYEGVDISVLVFISRIQCMSVECENNNNNNNNGKTYLQQKLIPRHAGYRHVLWLQSQ